jgi:repressor LexA
MHRIQKQLLDFIAVQENFASLSLRKMAELIGAPGKPQTVKYHLQQLEQNGLIHVNLQAGVIKLVKKGYNKASTSPLYSVPVVGSANCGPATIFAVENISQYLKVSSSLLPRNKKGLFALIADGSSMNKAEVEPGKTIESGDFVLVDSEYKNHRNGDIVIAVIDGMATIKRLRYDLTNSQIVLEADSTEKYLPIFLHENDDFILNGKVVGIIKAN